MIFYLVIQTMILALQSVGFVEGKKLWLFLSIWRWKTVLTKSMLESLTFKGVFIGFSIGFKWFETTKT